MLGHRSPCGPARRAVRPVAGQFVTTVVLKVDGTVNRVLVASVGIAVAVLAVVAIAGLRLVGESPPPEREARDAPADCGWTGGGSSPPEFGPAEAVAEGFLQHGVLAADDTATIVWDSGTAMARQWSADGSWRSPEKLGEGSWPVLGVDGAGDVTAVWLRQNGERGEVKAADGSAEGRWSTPRLLADSPAWPDEDEIGIPNIAVNHAGDVAVAWDDLQLGVRAVYRPAGGDWASPVSLSSGARGARVAITSDGVATVAFHEGSRLHFAQWRNGRWTATVATPQGALDDSVEIDAAGPEDAVLMWKDPQTKAYQTGRIHDGKLVEIHQLGDREGPTSDEHVVAAEDGSAIFTWTRDVDVARSSKGIVAVTQPADCAPEPAEQIDREGPYGQFSGMAANNRGDAVLIWNPRPSRGQAPVFAMGRCAGSRAWSERVALNPVGTGTTNDYPQITITEDRSLLALWRNGRGVITAARGTLDCPPPA